jgi:hypothetical protein
LLSETSTNFLTPYRRRPASAVGDDGILFATFYDKAVNVYR